MMKHQSHVALKKAVKAAKKKKLGKQASRHARRELTNLLGNGSKAAAVGAGAYGRGAYGRGAYATGAIGPAPPAVNSLFMEYPRRRHKTSEVGDETGRVRVSRREYVMRVTAPTTVSDFDNSSFSINPGLSGVFAWLSQIAANYDEYTLEHLVFHYKPVISQASQSGAMGSILLSCNYNAGAAKFASFREMAEYMGTLETRICDEAYFGVECDPTKHGSQPVEFVRTGSVPVGQDIKTYDLGLFQIATSDIDSGFTPGSLLGHLYVEYEVMLGKPKLYTALGKGILSDMFRSVTGASLAAPFGTPIAQDQNTLGSVLTNIAGNIGVVTLPDNFYGRVSFNYYAEGNAIDVNSVTAVGNVTAVPILGGNGTATMNITYSPAAQVCANAYFDFQPALVQDGNQIRIRLEAATSIGGLCVQLTQINPSVVSW